VAIFGIGAIYDGDWDVSDDFVHLGVGCIGWSAADAPALHEILKLFKIGDIIFIKTSPPGQGIRVKAVGLVIDNQPKTPILNAAGDDLGTGIGVKWVWRGYENLGVINDKYNVRNNTLYEEFNPDVQRRIIDLLLKP
jgi:hypothetical protein